MWFKIAELGTNGIQFDRACKSYIRSTPFYANMCSRFGFDIKDLWRITFQMIPLEGRLAETRGDVICLSKDYVQKRGLQASTHLISHELVHWLKKEQRKEKYFADPEEVESFNWAIAGELSAGRSWDQIESVFLPIIEVQIKDPAKARHFLIARFRDARRLMKSR